MQPTFKIVVANDARNISISYAHEPQFMEDFVELFKNLMMAWGFDQEVVDAYFELDDLIKEHDEHTRQLEKRIEELEREVETLKGRTFQLHEGRK